ncbi:MAG: peptidase C1 [Ignavibacteriae bacterium]|nr:peptidase C1 [Ignavibacteriota bacterium]
MKRFYSGLIIFLFVFILTFEVQSQEPKPDKGVFIEYKNEFWDTIKKVSDEFNKPKKEEKKTFKLDVSNLDIPKSTNEFKIFKHTPPLSQGWTGTCWCFSTTSFLESEYSRMQNKELKLSEMNTVYWEYVEKARRFVRERGNSHFGEGSQANAVLRIWKQYGCVPENEYTGLLPDQKYYDHHLMFDEIDKYLQSVKSNNAWNEDVVLTTVKNILNHYMGEPPNDFPFQGAKMTAKDFLDNIVKINPDDYVDIMSLMEKPYWQQVEYEVPDNWWHSKVYYNVPLEDYMKTLKEVVKKGYSVAIGGDVSEAGYVSPSEIAMIPSFDIPSDNINEDARQFRFSNGTTTDDHGIHIVGYKEKAGKMWFLIKDSGSGAQSHTNKGYYFYHEDYIKLKMMSFTIHRSAVEELLKKFK